MRNLVLGVMAGTLVACGGTEPTVERNDPGTGTLTLRVTADIDANDVVGSMEEQTGRCDHAGGDRSDP